VELAERVAVARYLPFMLLVLDLADQAKRTPRAVAHDYFDLGRASGAFAAVEAIDARSPEGRYESLALKALRRELLDLVARLVRRLGEVRGDAQTKLASLGDAGREALEPLQSLEAEEVGPASLLVALERVRSLLR
jgi:NAD-specific glutamate dehydrogenase